VDLVPSKCAQRCAEAGLTVAGGPVLVCALDEGNHVQTSANLAGIVRRKHSMIAAI
jgi:hypothetical protein